MISVTLLADGAAPAGGIFGGGAAGMFLPFAVIFAIFYFLLIRPQNKRQRDHQQWIDKLQKDQEVVTTGGLWGKIKGITPNSPYVTLELQEKVRVRVLKSHITSDAPAQNAPPSEQSKS